MCQNFTSAVVIFLRLSQKCGNGHNPIKSMSKVFSLRIAFRVVVWKNKALATLARERKDLEAIERRKFYIKNLFLKTCKPIIIVYRWYRSLVEQSKEKTIKSALELQWEATYMEEHKLKKYEFDAANFSQKKATKVPQWMCEKVLYDFSLYLILISVIDQGSTVKVININSKRLKS